MEINPLLYSLSETQKLFRQSGILKSATSSEQLWQQTLNFSDKSRIAQLLLIADSLKKRSASAGISWLDIFDEHYSPLLRELHLPPALLFYRGNTGLLGKNLAAVVGTRKPSAISVAATRLMPAFLQANGFEGIVSGMAAGIDREIMMAALDSGMAVVGVLGTPVNREYPLQNRDLYEKMKSSDNALILSEYHLDETVHKYTFPKRNRIISGLSSGVFIMESPLKSGAMSTAAHATEQNRDLYFFSHPDQTDNEGGQRYINDGANCLLDRDIGLNVRHLDDTVTKLKDVAPVLADYQGKKLGATTSDMYLGF